MSEYNDELSELSIPIFLSSIGYDSEHISLMGGIASSNSTFNPVGMLTIKWNHFYLSAAKNYEVNFVPSDNYSLNKTEYLASVFGVGYENRQFKGNVKLFNYDGENRWGIRGSGAINLLWMNLNQQSGAYSLDSTANQPLNVYSLTRMLFSPNIWPWQMSRFQPFIGMESIYIQHSSQLGIDPINPAVFYHGDRDAYSSHLLNMEIGILVRGFKLSYRWVNFNLTGTKATNSLNPNSYPIPFVRHLEVVWQFWN